MELLITSQGVEADLLSNLFHQILSGSAALNYFCFCHLFCSSYM